MVPLRLLALPAELRRRHRRPLDLPDRRGRAERRCGHRLRRMVAEPLSPTAMRRAPARTPPTARPAFIERQPTPSQWNGNWAALPVVEAFGDDALFLPAPDFGNGPVIGAASWQFGVSATSENPDGARAFIEFALQDRWFAAFSDGTGLIPDQERRLPMTKNYKPGGALGGVLRLSEAQAVRASGDARLHRAGQGLREGAGRHRQWRGCGRCARCRGRRDRRRTSTQRAATATDDPGDRPPAGPPGPVARPSIQGRSMVMASKLTRSNRAGWLMALPGVALIASSSSCRSFWPLPFR